MDRLIVVDDDASVREALANYLRSKEFSVRAVADAVALDSALEQERPDLVVLDLMLPGENGLSICRRLSAVGQPVLMLSAMGSAMDRIAGLEVGADDYLPKPFEPRELLARVRSILRREKRATESGVQREDAHVLEFAGWHLDVRERQLHDPAGQALRLTAGEFALIHVFALNPGRLLSRDRLQDLARGPDTDSFDRAIDLAVSRLRRKLGERDVHPLIETIRGEGYRCCPKVVRQ